MKPLKWVVFGAVLAVAAILYWSNSDAGSDRRQNRRAADERATDGRREGENAATDSGARAKAKQSGADLAATLRIVRADGSPATGAETTLTGPVARTVAAASDGSVELGNLAPGIYNLIARSGGEAGALDFELKKSTDLGTLVLHDTIVIRGRVMGSSEANVEAVRVSDRSAFDITSVIDAITSPEAVVARTRVGNDGSYELRVPAGQRIALRAWAVGYAPRMRRVDIEPGTSHHDLGRAVLSRGHGIEGAVVDEAGEPIPNVEVHVIFDMQSVWEQPASPEDGTVSAPGRRYGQGTTDAAGRFAIHGLRAGKYEVEGWGNGSYSSSVIVKAGTKDVRITLMPAGTLIGRVMSGGKPVANASVTVSKMSSTFDWAETDEEGRFKLDRLPPHETFQVEIDHDGYLDLVVKDVRATKVSREFVLDPGAHIGGLVTDPAGRPLAGVTVTVDAGDSSQSVKSQANGRFFAGGLGEGEIVVYLSASDDGYISTRPLTVAPGDESVVLIAKKGESIAGIVLDANGAPVKRVMITVFDHEGTSMARDLLWGADGNFEVNGLPKGRYTVRASLWTQDESEPFAEATDVATGTRDLKLKAR